LRDVCTASRAAPAHLCSIRPPCTFIANPHSAAAGISCLDVIRDGKVHEQINAMTRSLLTEMNARFARRGVRGVAYGEASRFNLAFDQRLTPGDPQSLRNVPADALKEQRPTPVAASLALALLLRGVHLMAMGGFVSTAHTREDLARTADALDGALEEIQTLAPR